MRDIVIVQSRPEDEVADAELEAMVRYGNLDASRVQRIRLDREPPPEIDVRGVDAILVGGGPANFSDATPDPASSLVMTWLTDLARVVVRDDVPYLGACLGLGAIVHALDSAMERGVAESVAPVEVRRRGDDWLTDGFPDSFTAFGGHKEGIVAPPSHTRLLGESAACVHMIRAGEHVVATQFHPELDAEGLEQRIRAYQRHGYFAPDEVEQLVAAGYAAHVRFPQQILSRFAERYSLMP